MMNTQLHSAGIVFVVAFVTILIRFSPFLIFKKHVPEPILYLGKVLPYAIMSMLVVYCLKGMSFGTANDCMPSIIGVAAVVLLHKWKHNTLFSILGATILYMVLVQVIFV